MEATKVIDYRLQDPGEALDHPIDWSDWLQSGESIASVSFTITPDESPTLVSADSPGFTGDVSTCTVDGVEMAEIYRLTHTIVTTVGRRGVRSLTIRGFKE